MYPRLSALSLDPKVEQEIMGSVKQTENGAFLNLDPNRSRAIIDSVGREVQKLENLGKNPIIITSPIVRMYFRRLTEDYYRDLVVVSYNDTAAKFFLGRLHRSIFRFIHVLLDYHRPVREESLSAEEKVSIEKKLDNLQALMMSRFQHSEAQRQEVLESGEEAVPGEDGQEKQEEKQETSEQERFIRLLYNTMLDSEVDEKYANQIVNEMDVAGKKNLPFDYILEGVYQKMILKFGKAEGITAAEGMPKVVKFLLNGHLLLRRKTLFPDRPGRYLKHLPRGSLLLPNRG